MLSPIHSAPGPKDRYIYLGVCVILLAIGIVLALTLNKQTQKYHSLKEAVELERYQRQFLIPSEALYYDDPALRANIAVRAKLYKQKGTTDFLPYRAVAQLVKPQIQLNSFIPTENISTSDPNGLYIGSYEMYWNSRVTAICEELANLVSTGEGWGKTFLENPDLFQEKLEPLVRRLLKSYDPFPKRAACRALIALGHRDPAIKTALQELLEDPALNEADKQQLKEWQSEL